MRIVMGRLRKTHYLSPAVGEQNLRLVRLWAFRNGEFVIQPREPRCTGEDKLSAGYRSDVEIRNLVETACKQSRGRIIRQGLALGASGQYDEEDKTTRPHEHCGRTQRHGITPQEQLRSPPQQRALRDPAALAK